MSLRNNLINNLVLLVLSLTIISCGEGTVDIGKNTYAPKIVIEGYLYPGQKVRNIKITRNIPLNTKIDPVELLLTNADVELTDLQRGKDYKLAFSKESLSFEYNGADLAIEFDKSYKLTVTAVIDGKTLTANSTTHLPKSGFKILDELTTQNSITYRQRKEDNSLENIALAFSPSSGSNFYFISMVALNAGDSSFIYGNPYVNVTVKDVNEKLDRYKYQMRWLQNINSEGPMIKYDLDWINFWFYGDYRIIVYACDENFRLYVQTYKNVQEFDGNFHEPRINISGDGIGIFGSAIADTVYLKVQK